MIIFDKVFVERHIRESTEVTSILNRVQSNQIIEIHDHRTIFDQYPNSYLSKRKRKHLILADYKGEVVKEAPPAYGFTDLPHYYFIHTKNCIYECQYCFLQGYFASPDIVVYANYNRLCNELKSSFERNPNGAWYHAGEFSDSLALSSVTGELPVLFSLFKDNPKQMLELRTKSQNIKALEGLPQLSNVVLSFSLSPVDSARRFDLRAASTNARLLSMQSLQESGHSIAVHLDPIILTDNYRSQYSTLVNQMSNHLDLGQIKYLSLGTVRFTKPVMKEVRANYPKSEIHNRAFIRGFDGKYRYHRPVRMEMLKYVRTLLVQAGCKPEVIYDCMEESDPSESLA